MREPLREPLEVDVAIVGAGYTGLWSAYYLKRAAPHLQIAVLEREVAGYGASGRNGGWVSGFFAGAQSRYEARSGRPALEALQREMFATVDEVGGFLREHGVEADYIKSGQLGVAIGPAQATRLRERVAAARARDIGEEHLRELSAAELGERVRVRGALAATFTPHVARIHPAKLVGAWRAWSSHWGWRSTSTRRCWAYPRTKPPRPWEWSARAGWFGPRRVTPRHCPPSAGRWPPSTAR